jgi:hypothetical protein
VVVTVPAVVVVVVAVPLLKASYTTEKRQMGLVRF